MSITKKITDSMRPQDAILSFANILTGVLEFGEQIEKGKNFVEAAQSAYRKGARRAKALSEATIKAEKRERKIAAAKKETHESNVRLLACSCCGLPPAQCMNRDVG